MESHEEEKKDTTVITVEFELSDGRKCVVSEGTGVDITEATRVCGDKKSEIFLFALIARLTTIDGNRIVAEDLSIMKLKDAMTIQAKFSDLNF
ncbi:MAG: hypothetical protein D4R97_06435 [Bacteroidetes bacterium]|nr:MAG: hypothetical protein D4R97_06435 [Bacteroidota bacterium]